MLFAADVLVASRCRGDFDVKCTRNLFAWIRQHGGRPLLWKTGQSLIKSKRARPAAARGRDERPSFFKDRWYGFDDGLYAGARLRSSLEDDRPTTMIESLPDSISTPELNVALEKEGEQPRAHRPAAEEREIRGRDRREYDTTVCAWRIPTASASCAPRTRTPVLVLRFEGDSHDALARIQRDFKRVLLSAKPDARVPF